MIDVTAGLIFRNGRLLLTQRPQGKQYAGFWEMPGGKRKLGETLSDCLVRELQEELRITVHVHQLLKIYVHDQQPVSLKLHFFLCSLDANQEPSLVECADLRWVDFEELSQYQVPPADRAMLEDLQSGEYHLLFKKVD